MTEEKLRAEFIWRLCRCRPLGLRAANFARRVGSLSGTSLPPTGGAPWPSGSSGAHQCLAGQPCTSDGAYTRDNGGGFAALEVSPRRVAGVSRLYWCNSPRLLAVRSRFGAVRRPKCRPPRRQTPTMGCCGRGGLRCGHNGAWPRVELAREPAIACADRLFRT